MGLFSDFVNGALDFFSGSDKPCCAACKKCQKTFTEGNYKRVFICTDNWYNYDLGFPILGTKISDVTPPTYPPCNNNAFETASTNGNPLDYTSRLDIAFDDWQYDWNIDEERKTDPTNQDNNW